MVELERAYTRSASLDGDAVVVFMRALCAVSQEELEAGSSSTASSTGGAAAGGLNTVAAGSTAPRLFSLQKVVECAYHNMFRIRLVWAKLWAVIAAQLVGASCHPYRRVALYAVDSLRQLVTKLLARAELEHFTYQEDALRPFVAVLRQCDEAPVRELAVQCIMQAVSSHPGGLGSGWRMVILALRLGAADGSPAVMAQAQEALQLVVGQLYSGGMQGSAGGHTFLRETVQAIVAGIRNPAHLELSMSAVQLLGRCGQQLAAFEDAGGREEVPAAALASPSGVDLDGDYGWGLLLRTLADVLQHDRRPQVADAALEMLFGLLGRYSQRWDAAAWRVLVQRVEQGALMTVLLQRMDRYYPLLCEQAVAIRLEGKVELVQQLAAIGVTWYQQNSIYLSTAGIKALMRLAETLSIIVKQSSKGASGSSTAAAAAGGGGGGGLFTGSPSGSPRAHSRRSTGAAGSFNGTASLLGARGGVAAARQLEAAAAAQHTMAMQLRIRSRQLVLVQRGLSEALRSGLSAAHHLDFGGASTPGAATAQLRQRLLQLVRRIIQSEAAASTSLDLAAGGPAGGAAGGQLLQHQVRDNPLQDALAGVGWDHAARAPLVVAALQVLSGLQGQEYQQEVLALYPALCRLMCSSHLLTRQQLHKVFSSQFLELLPAFAAAVDSSP
eukprot:gene4219-4468_t